MATKHAPNTLAGELAEPAVPAIIEKHACIVHGLFLKTAGAIECCDDEVGRSRLQLGCSCCDTGVAAQLGVIVNCSVQVHALL